MLPWHQTIWERLQAQRVQGRLPHALLVAGPPGVGKAQLAQALAGALVCTQLQHDGRRCGACRGCRLFDAHVHPDVLHIATEEAAKVITVDQIRRVVDFAAMTRQQAPVKVVLIAPADRMNINAANSLLKTLEEPTPHTILILVTASPSLLPATVLSRCQRYNVDRPPTALARAWLTEELGAREDTDVLLALSNGAPCLARDLAQSDMLALRQRFFESFVAIWRGQTGTVDSAAWWSKHDMVQAMYWLNGWLVDMVRIKSGASREALNNPDLTESLASLAQPRELATLLQMEQRIREALRYTRGQANGQLLWEAVLKALDRQGTPTLG